MDGKVTNLIFFNITLKFFLTLHDYMYFSFVDLV